MRKTNSEYVDQFCRYNDEILELQRTIAQQAAVIKEQKETIEQLNLENDFNDTQANHYARTTAHWIGKFDAQTALIENISSSVERCYKMLLSEPDTKGALFKAENILRETLADLKEMK